MQSEATLYEHRQIGWLTIIVLVVTLVILLAVQASTADATARQIIGTVFFLLLVVGSLFSSLTIRVTPSCVEWWLGIGGLGRRVTLDEIASVAPTRTNILEGWGIHLTIWHGWVWNVSGFNAVEITLKTGTRYAVGTPEPQAVIAALEKAKSRT